MGRAGREGSGGVLSLTHLYLNQESSERKGIPLATGVLDYFPAALAYVAKVSKYGNDKHNPGQPMHHARGKSMDHADTIARHLVDRGGIEPDTGLRHSGFLAWRALALLQEELEREEGAPLARAAKLPTYDVQTSNGTARIQQGPPMVIPEGRQIVPAGHPLAGWVHEVTKAGASGYPYNRQIDLQNIAPHTTEGCIL